MNSKNPLHAELLRSPPAYVPLISGRIRSSIEDFQVDELLGFEPEGEGEHLWLQVRKRSENSEAAARKLARVAGIPVRAVGFAGLKDRHAVTTQWFSLHLPGGNDPDPARFETAGLEILSAMRDRSKLRRGDHEANRFRLVLRELSMAAGSAVAPEQIKPQLAERIATIRRRGIPNYFGPQRFGRDGSNLTRAQALCSGALSVPQNERGMLFSALRSALFNRVLAYRVEQQCWAQLLQGEVAIRARSEGLYRLEQPGTLEEDQCRDLQLHPTGPLVGSGGLQPRGEAAALEGAQLEPHTALIEGLARFGLRGDRRALRIAVPDLLLTWLDDTALRLEFTLPPGSYATVLLAQLGRFDQGDGALSEAVEP